MIATAPYELTEEERVENWRAEELVRAGYPADDALPLARDFRVDLHVACELLTHGCPLKTALLILR